MGYLREARECLVCGVMQDEGYKYCKRCAYESTLGYRAIYESKSYKQANIKNTQRWRRENPEKHSVQQFVRSLIRSHRRNLVKILYECRCEVSYSKHLHHFDYGRPLEVIALCKICHNAEHKRLKGVL